MASYTPYKPLKNPISFLIGKSITLENNNFTEEHWDIGSNPVGIDNNTSEKAITNFQLIHALKQVQHPDMSLKTTMFTRVSTMQLRNLVVIQKVRDFTLKLSKDILWEEYQSLWKWTIIHKNEKFSSLGYFE